MPRKDLTLKEKIFLLNKLKTLPPGNSLRRLSEILEVPKSTISRILHQEDKLRKEWAAIDAKLWTSQKRRKRGGKNPDVEKALINWFSNVTSKGIRVTGAMLMSKAEELAKNLNHFNFKATDGWLSRWKVRHNIKLMKSHAQGNFESGEKCKTVMNNLMQQFLPDDMYKTDETGINFLTAPDGSLCNQKSMECLTGLCCTNATESDKEKRTKALKEQEEPVDEDEPQPSTSSDLTFVAVKMESEDPLDTDLDEKQRTEQGEPSTSNSSSSTFVEVTVNPNNVLEGTITDENDGGEPETSSNSRGTKLRKGGKKGSVSPNDSLEVIEETDDPLSIDYLSGEKPAKIAKYDFSTGKITIRKEFSDALLINKDSKRGGSTEEHSKKENNEDIIDEDKEFLLSLLPVMKELTSAQKMEFKTIVLNELKRLRFPTLSTGGSMGNIIGTLPKGNVIGTLPKGNVIGTLPKGNVIGTLPNIPIGQITFQPINIENPSKFTAIPIQHLTGTQLHGLTQIRSPLKPYYLQKKSSTTVQQTSSPKPSGTATTKSTTGKIILQHQNKISPSPPTKQPTVSNVSTKQTITSKNTVAISENSNIVSDNSTPEITASADSKLDTNISEQRLLPEETLISSESSEQLESLIDVENIKLEIVKAEPLEELEYDET